MNTPEHSPPQAEAASPERDPFDLKKDVNNLVWMYGPGSMTLDEAEARALHIVELILSSPKGGN